jgi:hypothetical protein
MNRLADSRNIQPRLQSHRNNPLERSEAMAPPKQPKPRPQDPRQPELFLVDRDDIREMANPGLSDNAIDLIMAEPDAPKPVLGGNGPGSKPWYGRNSIALHLDRVAREGLRGSK